MWVFDEIRTRCGGNTDSYLHRLAERLTHRFISHFQTVSNSSLSVELYSDPAHFVLELIQNLDDTAYPPNVTPTATFQLQGETLTVESNQSGFTEADVLSICDMGQSSKLPASGIVKDSLGEKGIGTFHLRHSPSCLPLFKHLTLVSYFSISSTSSSHPLSPSAFNYFLIPSPLSCDSFIARVDPSF